MRNESETDANNYEWNNNERKHAIWKTKEADWPVEKNTNLDDAKQQQHSRDTLINNWQHSAR